MDCRIIQVEQGSDEWLDLRRTRITCSRLAAVMSLPKKCPTCKGKGRINLRMCDTCKGKKVVETKRHKRYREEKIKELCGHKAVEETPEWAEHGKKNEGRALLAYEYQNNIEVEHNVFLISKKYDWLSCSPDLLHLPNHDEGGEIKCRELYKNYRKFKKLAEEKESTTNCLPAADRHQVQGAMWVTGFSFWWYINYYIGTDPQGAMVQRQHRVSVPRNQTLIDMMEIRCLEFMKEAYKGANLA